MIPAFSFSLPCNRQLLASTLTGLALCWLSAPAPLQAAGGPHVVDDADVETPGVCHLESWLSHDQRHNSLAVLAPACTLEALPRLELGGFIERSRGEEAVTSFGPALKLKLAELASGVELGLIGAATWQGRSARFDAAELVLPLSLELKPQLRSHFNLGWHHEHGDGDGEARRNRSFIGAQLEVDVDETLMTMAEIFGHSSGRAGAQLGLRWTPAGGDVDLDLLSGWRLDGSTPWTITLGLTIRH